MMWMDVHTHLNMLEDSPEQVIAMAEAVGVQKIVTIGTEPADLPLVIDFVNKFPGKVYGTLGVHPHEGKVYSNEVEEFIRKNSLLPNIIGIGEIGLDFYYNHSEKSQQIEAFRKQMELAKTLQLPVQIHTRDAEKETKEVLKEYSGKVKGIIHCFTGTKELAQKALDFGFNISFSGIITFRNADTLREVVKMVPIDRMHLESDAPFLSPVPVRGKKNTPAFIVHTAKLLAELKQCELENLKNQLYRNALEIFPKLVSSGENR